MKARVDLEGDLAVVPAELVLQLLAQARLGGLLEVEAPAGPHRIFLAQGRVIYAEAPARASVSAGAAGAAAGRAGREALARTRIREAVSGVLAGRRGRFRFRRAVSPAADEVLLDMNLESLLLECLAQLDHVRGGRDADAG
ncbi:MAG: DUF4388 domain-containing protein [Candidatus Latescibacterota bacterium]|nr:MAG: DUF4388 domain-containing protein [Candidatus Latescibacterota bacterium]